MKKILKHLFLMLMLSAGLVACNTDSDDTAYFTDFGTIETFGLKKVIKLDVLNKTVFPINYDMSKVEDGDRVFLYYSIAGVQDTSSKILNINIEQGPYKIPTKNVNFVNSIESDTLGGGLFYNLTDSWISGDYLTTAYDFFGSNKSITYLGFDTRGITQPVDTIQLQLSRKEPEAVQNIYQFSGLVSFRLDRLRSYTSSTDSVVLAINYKTSSYPSSGHDTTNRVVYRTYKFRQ